jgi:hypothetical protein
MNVEGITTSVTLRDIRNLIPTRLGDASVQTALNTALILVKNQSALMSVDSDTRDFLILYLAAHYVTVQAPRPSSMSLRGASESYQGQTGMSLKSSMFGQTAIAMDTTGTLAQLDTGGIQIQFDYMGSDAT